MLKRRLLNLWTSCRRLFFVHVLIPRNLPRLDDTQRLICERMGISERQYRLRALDVCVATSKEPITDGVDLASVKLSSSFFKQQTQVRALLTYSVNLADCPPFARDGLSGGVVPANLDRFAQDLAKGLEIEVQVMEAY